MRLIGGLLTVAAFFLCGTSVAGESLAELRTVEAMLSLLRELSRRLLWSRDPLHTLFPHYCDPLLEKYGFLPALRQANGRNYPAVWAEAVGHLPLPEQAKNALEAFGSSLGRVSLDTQKEQLSLCIHTLEEARDKAREQAGQKQRSTVALWTLSGLLAALLLL